MIGVEPPQRGVINLRIAEFGDPRVSTPGALVLMHLKQPLLDTRVNADGDEALDLLACKCVLVVAVTIVGCDVGVPQGSVGWSCMASSVPERTLRHKSSRSAKACRATRIWRRASGGRRQSA